MNILFILFFEFLKISLFTIGGGLAMIPVISDTFVRKHKLLQEQDIIDMVAITQTVPGLIAVNSAVFVGRKLAGHNGSFIATVAVILPSVVIIMIIAALFPLENLSNQHAIAAFSYVRACVLGLFLVLAGKMGKNIFKSIIDIPFLCLLLFLLFLKLNPAIIVLISCLLGGIYETYVRSKIMGVKEK